VRDGLAQDLQPFGSEIGAEHGIAGDISARPGEARDQAGPHRIADADHDDGDARRRLLGRVRRRRAVGRDQIHRAAYQLRRGRRQPIRRPVDIAEFAQSLSEGLPHRRIVEDTDARYFRRWLRMRRERPRRSGAPQ
jgi:hypothetical protein